MAIFSSTFLFLHHLKDKHAQLYSSLPLSLYLSLSASLLSRLESLHRLSFVALMSGLCGEINGPQNNKKKNSATVKLAGEVAVTRAECLSEVIGVGCNQA